MNKTELLKKINELIDQYINHQLEPEPVGPIKKPEIVFNMWPRQTGKTTAA